MRLELDWGVDSCYNGQMRMLWILLTLCLQGCAFTAVSTGTYVLTGKSIADHTATMATGNNCDATMFMTGQQAYWCEQPREPGTTYNRHSF